MKNSIEIPGLTVPAVIALSLHIELYNELIL